MIATIADKNRKRSSIVAVMLKPLFSDRSNHRNHMETSLYGNRSAIKVATIAHLFLSDRSDHTGKPALT